MDAYPVTVLDSNLYRREDFNIRDGEEARVVENGDFVVFKRNRRGKVVSKVALVEFDYLSNANRRQKEEEKEEYQMRCALVKKEDGKLTAIATTAPNEKIDSGAALANLYYDRMKSHLSKSMEKKRKEVAKWKEVLENTPFYEIDTEMDHIMTNFKILHENSLLFAKDVFFEGNMAWN